MKPSRVILILTAVLASATFAHAQSPSAASLEAIRAYYYYSGDESTYPREALQKLPDLPQPYVIGLAITKPISGGRVELVGQAKTNPPEAPTTCQSCWFTQAVQHSVAAFQRVRAMCGSQAKAEPACGLCPAAGCGEGRVTIAGHQSSQGFRIYWAPAFMPNVPAVGCCVGEPATPFMKAVQKPAYWCIGGGGEFWCPWEESCSGIKDVIQFCNPVPGQVVQVGKAPAPCCCAKACACCEACKAKPAQGTWVPMPSMKRVIVVPTQTLPTPPTCGTVQLVQQALSKPHSPPGLIPMTGIHPALARFETPDLEAHCQKITHRGDTVILEGNVLLLVKKHAQPVRVNAERVIVNMKDGSYTVEGVGQISTSGFGIMRTSAMPVPVQWAVPAQECVPAAPVCRDECEMPKQRIIQVVPVPVRSGQPAPLPTPPVFPR